MKILLLLVLLMLSLSACVNEADAIKKEEKERAAFKAEEVKAEEKLKEAMKAKNLNQKSEEVKNKGCGCGGAAGSCGN